MSLSMGIHSSYSSFCIPSGGSMTITDGHAPARKMDDLQRDVMKNNPQNSWDVWGKNAPQMFPYKSSEKFYERQSLTLVENEGSVNFLLQN
ncbi:hypothetical protein AVEN_268214-1 [Araneus ventricosus]|uniref:Uncharacterized protein n=1 Tax=Araneus ventricosus TaxID=182803 RepID=A0A4Y2PTC9_ARAVE|nr:hypothetical protein AVEN_266572-1 [Araneus ventricosus]GBN53376.1 hypothetical protein AVEN_268214-1 [Araneus ventricosus]